MIKSNNELIPFTIRPTGWLLQKQRIRDHKVAKRLINAWDNKQDQHEVFNIFIKEHKNLSDPRYWELLRSVWIICGSIENRDVFRSLMQSYRPHKHFFMTTEEQDFYNKLPDIVQCYRACDNDDGGLSYTLNYEYAQQYRKMFDKKIIYHRGIPRDKIFAYINRNNESEVIIL